MKTYDHLRRDLVEYQAPTAHTAHVTDRISVRTDLSNKAKRPSVKQLKKLPMTKAEREKKGVHFFQLGGDE